MNKYYIDHFTINKHYEVMAENEQDAWEYFLDRLLSIEDMAEDYFISEVPQGVR